MDFSRLYIEEHRTRLTLLMEEADGSFQLRNAFDVGMRIISARICFLSYQRKERALSQRVLRVTRRFFEPTLRPLSSLSRSGLLPQAGYSSQQQLEDLV